jgi:hypothetical protein
MDDRRLALFGGVERLAPASSALLGGKDILPGWGEYYKRTRWVDGVREAGRGRDAVRDVVKRNVVD